MERREFLAAGTRFAGGLFLLENKGFPLLNYAFKKDTEFKIQEAASDEITEKLIREYLSKGGFQYFGGRLTPGIEANDGSRYLVLETAVLQEDASGQVKLWDTTKRLKILGKDKDLESGDLGVMVPQENTYKKTFFDQPEERISEKETPLTPELVSYTKRLREDGLEVGSLSGFANYNGVFSVYRFDNMVLQQRDNGEINHVLMGHAFVNTGIVPSGLILSPAVIDEPKHLPYAGCRASGFIQEGPASFYSHAGCVGCSRGQIMANGEPFRENDLTIAHNSLPLGSLAWVENLDTGLGTMVRVTDRGGFTSYGLIADLSKGTKDAIGGGSRTRVRITGINC